MIVRGTYNKKAEELAYKGMRTTDWAPTGSGPSFELMDKRQTYV